jgi:hypothetical protein
MQDRRRGIERREVQRIEIDLDVEWETSAGRRSGSISDISEKGCFVLSSGDVTDGEPVRLYIPLADGMKVEFSGIVANHVFEIGFAVQFDPLNSAQLDLLRSLMGRVGG